MGQDDKNVQKEGQGQAQAEPLPQEGDQVSWNWGAGQPKGTVTETATSGEISIETKRGNTVKKNADEENPALLISRPGADQQDVVKRASEVEVIDQAEGAAKASSTTAGEGQESKQADSTPNTRKRKEQASTPTKKAATKGKTRGDGNNSAKKVRTGKEDDIFGSDIESDTDDTKEEDKDIVLEDAEPVVDPDETEDEKDHLKPAGPASGGTNGQEQDKKEKGAATDTNTAETGTSEPPRIIRKPHGHSKSLGANVLQPSAAAASSDGKSNTTTTSRAGTRGNGNGKEKPRSLSASAASGGGGDAVISRKEEEKSKSGGAPSKGEEEEGKEHELKRKGSIDEIFNEEKQDTPDKVPAALPPRHAKEVAEEKMAGASGTEEHDGGEAGKKTAADGAAGREADKSGGGADGK